ncbi:hypothetical protein JYU34_004410 [Plutella xylostella]|uniref:FLYWCH-type domain-containing protein n=1 Tax=Plutella xylostella TaxID=51655 RepID=A0ABQ7QXY2_PLUXY|nr:hypothetical protein JYU34_004410 [Plutella xylostella]
MFTNKNGKKMLRIDAYRFTINKRVRNKYWWRCSSHGSRGCRATVITLDDLVYKIANEHNH